ncbi:DNA ligase [Marinobacterium arenosum]|uniref:DNA ligase n=1 Tax=Marinobacterium arenosum TaxID=2862496 RepID=UPI001C966910|nr:DNA ligase [Marinobacterium arenosum]MBY4678214.1 DNA ligase [Marinobacterium arenosum]
MKLLLIPLLLMLLLMLPISLRAASQAAPELMLAQTYQPGITVGHYWVSEKYDGVRAYWDGEHLLTRSGQRINAPAWFTRGFPSRPLDGELWLGRDRFEEISGLVRRRQPDQTLWKQVGYMVFDLPPASPDEPLTTFAERHAELEQRLAEIDLPWLKAVPQRLLADDASLQQALREIVELGGEGLILRRADSLYQPARSLALLKLKPFSDAEATVVGYTQGKGKYRGMAGALLVERADGLRFRIGSGLTDQLRREPPPIGSKITYRYNGETNNGIPRFARYLRPWQAF